MASFLAVEYGTARVRFLEFDGSRRNVRIVAVGEADIDITAAEGEGEDVANDLRAERIAEAMEEAGFALDPSVMSFPASRAVFREFDLPFTNDEQIRKVVRFEAESHLPMDVETVVVQNHVLRKAREKSHLLAAAVEKEALLDTLDIIEVAGIDPLMVDLDAICLFNALQGTGVADESDRLVVVNAQDRETTLLFIEEGHLVGVRSIRLGAHGIQEQQEGEASEEENSATDATVREYITRLEREIRRTLTTMPTKGEPDKVYVLGSGGRVDGLLEAVGGSFGAEAEELDLLSLVDHQLSDEDAEGFGPDIGVALGLAFKLNGVDQIGMDFRQEEVAYTKKFDQVKTPVIMVALLMFLLTAFFSLDKYNEIGRLERNYEQLIATGRENLARLMDDPDPLKVEAAYSGRDFGPDQMQAIRNATWGLREEIADQLGRSSTIPPLKSVVGVWIEFNRMLQENKVELGRFRLGQMTIDLTQKIPTMKFGGEGESMEKFQQLLDQLEQHPMCGEINPGATKQGAKGSLVFTDLRVVLDVEAAEKLSRGEMVEGEEI